MSRRDQARPSSSSYEYFAGALGALATENTASISSNGRECALWLNKPILEGYVSSAGMGSESVLQVARQALVDCMSTAPTDKTDSRVSVRDTANMLVEVFQDNLTNDRVVLPLLETIAFLLDVGVLLRLEQTDFKYVGVCI